MKNVMVDLETLGNSSNSVIISIGAVEFEPGKGLGREFYVQVDPQSCTGIGLQMDASTVMWWMRQSDAARAAFNNGKGAPLNLALCEFSAWYPKDASMWGNGATFDNVILGNAYKAAYLTQPWPYWADRCYRTLKNLRPDIPMDRTEGVYHNALDDARNQAKHAVKILEAMGV